MTIIHKIQNLKTLHFWCLPLVLYVFYYFFFVYPFAFNYEVDKSGQYQIAFLVFAVWVLFTLYSLISGAAHTLLQKGCLLMATSVSVVLSTGNYYSFPNEYLVCVTVSFLFFTCLLWGSVRLLKVILLLFTIAFGVQLLMAMVQMAGGAVHVQGSLQNSGILSCYLVIQLPFLYYVFFQLKVNLPASKQIRQAAVVAARLLFGVLTAAVILLVYQLRSRTAIIALGLLLFFFLLLHFRAGIVRWGASVAKAYVWGALVLLIAAAAGGSWYLFGWKKLSVYGRLFMVQVAWEHLPDFFLGGTGIGRFTWYYPQWQSAYFAAHPSLTDEYFLSAGDSFIIFNEYLQLFQSIGMVGFIICLLGLLLFFTTTSVENRELLLAAKLTVIAILGCGFTSYPLHVNVLLLQLAFCFAVAALTVKSKPGNRLARLFSFRLGAGRLLWVVALVPAVFAAYGAFKYWQAKQQWDVLRNQVLLPAAEGKAEYIRLLTPLKNDGKFLNEYGMFLCEGGSDDYSEGVAVLRTAKRYFISRAGMEALGRTCQAAGRYREAAETFIWLDNYVPNRFSGKQALLRLYCEAKDTAHAIKVAEKILAMPVKIPSAEVDRIKTGAKEALSGFAN